MRLRHIEIFHAVYVSGSVSNAARSLNVSQPTVSKVLRHAEDQLGFELFHRERGKLFPTEKGQLLFQQIVPVFEQISELRKYTNMLASTRIGRLRVAMTPAFSLEVGPKAVAEFCELHPDISVEVETQHSVEIKKLLLNNSIDIGIVYEATSAPGIAIQRVGETEFICLSPKSFNISRKNLRLSELPDYPLIRLNAKSPLGQSLENLLETGTTKPLKSTIVAETYHLAKRLAAQSVGLAIVDKITAFSGQTSQLNFHEMPDIESINIHVMLRSDEPLVSYKKEFIRILKTQIVSFGRQ